MNITMKKTRIVVFLIIFFAIIIFNDKFMPVRKEITELELIKIIGMDKIEDDKYKIEQTIVRLENNKSSSSNEQEGEESKPKPNYFSVKGVSFTDVIRSFQTYTNKTLAGSHINCFLIGEEFSKQDLRLSLDFNVRDYEVRLNTSIYITKGTSAKEFITQTVNSEYEIDEKIESMEKNNESKSVSSKTTTIDLLKILTDKNGCGLIPTLKIISKEGEEKASEEESNDENIQDFQSNSIEKNKKSEPIFDFDGYGIIYKNVLKAYLSREESITTNILRDISVGTNMNIENDDGKIISFGILRSGTKYKAKFKNNHLSEIIINTKFESNFDEVSTEEDIFTEEKMSKLKKKQEEQMKKEIEEVIGKLKEYECDFLNIKDKIKVKYPYKFAKIEENFQEELLKAKFTINVECNIRTTYDVLSINH